MAQFFWLQQGGGFLFILVLLVLPRRQRGTETRIRTSCAPKSPDQPSKLDQTHIPLQNNPPFQELHQTHIHPQTKPKSCLRPKPPNWTRPLYELTPLDLNLPTAYQKRAPS